MFNVFCWLLAAVVWRVAQNCPSEPRVGGSSPSGVAMISQQLSWLRVQAIHSFSAHIASNSPTTCLCAVRRRQEINGSIEGVCKGTDCESTKDAQGEQTQAWSSKMGCVVAHLCRRRYGSRSSRVVFDVPAIEAVNKTIAGRMLDAHGTLLHFAMLLCIALAARLWWKWRLRRYRIFRVYPEDVERDFRKEVGL